MSDYYIVTAAWIFNDRPICGTFGVYTNMHDAVVERDRLANLPAELVHFAVQGQITWGISQDMKHA